jgi:hypothetical protein
VSFFVDLRSSRVPPCSWFFASQSSCLNRLLSRPLIPNPYSLYWGSSTDTTVRSRLVVLNPAVRVVYAEGSLTLRRPSHSTDFSQPRFASPRDGSSSSCFPIELFLTRSASDEPISLPSVNPQNVRFPSSGSSLLSFAWRLQPCVPLDLIFCCSLIHPMRSPLLFPSFSNSSFISFKYIYWNLYPRSALMCYSSRC